MGYQEFQPHSALRPYIDAYWVMKSGENTDSGQRIYPDGCIDIILNFGGEFLTNNGTFTMKNERAYLVGTMTRYIDIRRNADTSLLGIRFKPLGFPAFYQFSSLHEVTDKTVDFSKRLLPALHQYQPDTLAILNKFFYNRLAYPDHVLTQVLETIQSKRGVVSIDHVASHHCMTDRQLERKFKRYLGISPKAYANFVRYQYAIRLIQQKNGEENLLDVALDSGFYDHAHLTNEIKKYSGHAPSQLKMSDFSK